MTLDTLTPLQRSKRMRLVRSTNTKPEIAVRKLLHHLGFRFRLHRSDLPGRPDIVLPKYRTVVFVHGCFWHRHPEPTCRLARLPKSRLEFWEQKLSANRLRDEKNQNMLRLAGWRVLVVWECELRALDQLKIKLSSLLKDNGCAR